MSGRAPTFAMPLRAIVDRPRSRLSDADGYVLMMAAEQLDALVVALEACEENLRLIHNAAGAVGKEQPMPSHSTFGAWKLAHDTLAAMHQAAARSAPTNSTDTDR